jgi:hypothetical protein
MNALTSANSSTGKGQRPPSAMPSVGKLAYGGMLTFGTNIAIRIEDGNFCDEFS